MDETDLDYLENRIYEHVDAKYVRKEIYRMEMEELEERLTEKFRKELEYELKELRRQIEDLQWKVRDL